MSYKASVLFEEEENSAYQVLQYDNHRSVVQKVDDMGQNPRSWVLLYNQPTKNSFHNKKIFTNTRHANGKMGIHCNIRVNTNTLIGKLFVYENLWYHTNVIINILYL